MKQALGIAEMEAEVHLNLFVHPLGEMEGGVQVEAQVAYLDSTSEVGNVHNMFNVLPKIDGGFHHPWSSRSDKIKT